MNTYAGYRNSRESRRISPRLTITLLALYLLAVTGCNVDDGYDERDTRLIETADSFGPTAVFDPLTGNIPLPNDLAAILAMMGKQSAEITEASADLIAAAEAPSLAAYVDFTLPLDPASLPGAVVILDSGLKNSFTAAAPVPDLTFTEEPLPAGVRLRIASAAPLTAGHTYVAVIKTAVRGAAPHPYIVQSAPTFYFMKAVEPLVDAGGNPTVVLLASQPGGAELAANAEMLRGYYAPILDYLAANGIPRTEIALAWAFTL